MANPIFGYTSPFSSFVDPKRNQLMGMAAGLAGGGLGGMWQGGMQGSGLDMRAQEQQFEQEQRNQTAEWLKANYPQYAGLPPAEGFRAAMAEMGRTQGGANQPNFFGTPIWGVGPDGKPAFGQLNDQGQFQVTDTPEGFSFGKDPIKLDAGTHYILLDPVTRQQVGTIPKENEQAAFDTAFGSGQGKTAAETAAAAQSLASKMPGLQSVVKELGQLAQTATYTTTGQLIDNVMREAGQEPSEAAIARTKYMAMVDNQVLPLLRDTFGAAFTVQEGESLRATLGAPDKSPAEKQVVLEAFIEQKVRDLQALQSRVPGAGSGQVPGPRTTSTGVTWSQ